MGCLCSNVDGACEGVQFIAKTVMATINMTGPAMFRMTTFL